MLKIEMKKCTKCKLSKELNCFQKNKSKKSGLQDRCKQCWSLFNKSDAGKIKDQRRSKNPKRIKWVKNNQLLKLYNITLHQYELMLLEQNNVCAICNRPERNMHQKGKIKDLSVDHCHKTNKVRKLLCSNCK